MGKFTRIPPSAMPTPSLVGLYQPEKAASLASNSMLEVDISSTMQARSGTIGRNVEVATSISPTMRLTFFYAFKYFPLLD
jgi:hypothetical protein